MTRAQIATKRASRMALTKYEIPGLRSPLTAARVVIGLQISLPPIDYEN
jgi:hypothetical protein